VAGVNLVPPLRRDKQFRNRLRKRGASGCRRWQGSVAPSRRGVCELNRRPTFLGLPLFPSKTYCAQAWKEVVPVVIWRWVLHQLVESVGCFTRAELAFLMLAHRRI
jgi:hypothetical protein